MKLITLCLAAALSACGGSASSPNSETPQASLTPVARADNPCERTSWAAGTVEYCRG